MIIYSEHFEHSRDDEDILNGYIYLHKFTNMKTGQGKRVNLEQCIKATYSHIHIEDI